MQAEETITIYADFGMAPYAWRKKASDTTGYVGSNIADASFGLSKVIGTSVDLDQAFAEWIHLFDRTDYDKTLNWDRFHEKGVALAQRLKAEVGERYKVEYHPPWEDPKRGEGNGLITRIIADGGLQTYKPKNKTHNPSMAAIVERPKD